MSTTRSRRWKWLRLRSGARWPTGTDGRRLKRKLNRVGRICKRPVKIVSGLRTPYEQWVAYQDHLRGGVLAAPCCWRHYLHSWESCGRQCGSNHCVSRAADCHILTADGWVSIGLDQVARDAMRRVGLCLPVGSGEVWHVEVGDVWRS